MCLIPSRLTTAAALMVAMLPATARQGDVAYSPTGFIPNRGQLVDQQGKPNAEALFLFQGDGLNVQLRQGGFSYDTWQEVSEAADGSGEKHDVRMHRIDIDLGSSDPAARWEAFDASLDVLNYYTTGTAEEGVTGVHHYRRVLCRNIYPFIDLEFRTTDDNSGVKYDFIVRRGGDPAMIRMRYRGATAALNATSPAISLAWDEGVLHDRVPKSYWQTRAEQQHASVSLFEVEPNVFTFQLKDAAAPWTEDRTLVIDPVPDLEWGTYYGNADHHGSMNAVAIDASGNTFAAGTIGLTGMATAGTHDQTLSGSGDALLVKFDANGQRIWATYYGGNDHDFGNGVAVDANGNIYLTGDSWSTSGIATLFSHQMTQAGQTDAFLVKFTPQGTRVWGTYMGGSSSDRANSIVIDGAGNPAIAGTTSSTSGIATGGAADGTLGGGNDAFLAKFNASGVRQWSTYLGGTGTDVGNSVTCDGTIFFLAGTTMSASGIASGTAHDATYSGSGFDAYLVKYSGSGQKVWGTYYGSTGTDAGNSCFAETGTGNVYLAGQSTSTSGIATGGSHQQFLSGGQDGFLVKFNSACTRQWGTYLGGSGTDGIASVAVGSFSRVFVSGGTTSTSGIATLDAWSTALSGPSDAMAVGFTNSGSRVWGTYYGGEDGESALGMAVSGTDFALVGYTESSTGIVTSGAFQTTSNASPNNYSKFVARFTAPVFSAKNANAASDASDELVVRADAAGFSVVLPGAVQELAASTVMLRVADVLGRGVLEQRIPVDQREVRFDRSVCGVGAYLVILESADQRWVVRVVIH